MITTFERDMLRRSELLLGSSVMQRISEVRVIIFGVGGVGSWCAESLVRSGIRRLTIVDSDHVSITNCNRQLVATSRTVGRVKVEALRERLLELNPALEVEAIERFYDHETAPTFHIEAYDYVIDAIDSLQAKADLILQATNTQGVTLFCSMGAALRIDPTKVKASEFWKIEGDALARALRNKFKKQKTFPRRKFLCVCSEEVPMQNRCDQELVRDEWSDARAQINGSLAPVTATFGMTLCSLVLQHIVKTVNA